MSTTIPVRNNVRILGNGEQTMLLAHGFGCDQNMWRFITPAFENEYRLILFDYVGSGISDQSAYSAERYSTLDGYVQDVLDICEALDLSDVIFVGHSVSSIIGILASIRNQKYFNRLILIGPSACYINDPPYLGGFERADIQSLLDMMEKNYLGWASFLAPVIMKNPDDPERTQELEQSFCSTDPAIARRFAEATFFSDNRDDLPKAQVPSLIMQCSDDAIAPIDVGEYIHRHLPGSTFRLMKATGHCPHMSHPDETVQVIREYLATTIPSAPSGSTNT